MILGIQAEKSLFITGRGDGINMMDTVNTILAICGGISIIGGAVAVIWKWIKPAVNFRCRIERLEQKADNDFTSIQRIEEMQASMCQALIAIIDHDITGNHVEGLKKTKADLIKKLTEN